MQGIISSQQLNVSEFFECRTFGFSFVYPSPKIIGLPIAVSLYLSFSKDLELKKTTD